jgi:hypothetical protein
LLERREDAFPKHVDEGFLLTVDVVQSDLAYSPGEVLLQPGEVLLRVRRNADGGVQVFGQRVAGDSLELLRRPQLG